MITYSCTLHKSIVCGLVQFIIFKFNSKFKYNLEWLEGHVAGQK